MKTYNITNKMNGRSGLKDLTIEFKTASELRSIINELNSYLFMNTSKYNVEGVEYYKVIKVHNVRHSKMKVDLERINYKEFVRENKLEKILEL